METAIHMSIHPRGRHPATAGDRRSGRGELLVVLVMTSALLAGLSYLALQIYFKTTGVRLGIHLLGYDLGGLSASQLPDRVAEIVDTVYADPIYLRFRQHVWPLRYRKHFRLVDTRTEICRQVLSIGRDRSVYRQAYDWLTLAYPRVDMEFRPQLDRRFTQANLGAKLAKVWPGRVTARPIEGGRVELLYQSGEVDILDVVSGIERCLTTSPVADRRVVEIRPVQKGGERKVVDAADPKVGFATVLASRTVEMGPLDPATFDAITMAAERLKGLLLNPGEVLSVNQAIGRARLRTGSHPVGLSVVASALYEPLLRTGAKVIERHPHPHYYPELSFVLPGLDASQAGGADLKVMNEAGLPILFDVRLEADKLVVELKSVQDLPFRVEIRTGKVARVPFRTAYRSDPRLRRGVPPEEDQPGLEGIKVRVYRTYFSREDGRKEREELISTDEYARRERVLRVWRGFKPPPQEAPSEVLPRPKRSPPPVEEPEPPAVASDDADDPEALPLPTSGGAPAEEEPAPERDGPEDEEPAPTLEGEM